jgi:DNA phosphorothioation-associated putative methyltransferase
MEFEVYKQIVKSIQIGKKLPDALYIHESAFDVLPAEFHAVLDYLKHEYKADKFEFNIIKLGLRDYKISLLNYPTFFDESYPVLHTSISIDLVRKTKRKTSYHKSKNPPILHRKETFLPPGHPSVSLFEEITLEGEKAGLYENTKTIGFKQKWERLIYNKGYYLVEGRLKKLKKKKPIDIIADEEKPIEVKRHLTAIDRYSLSVPMQNLARHGFLDGDYSILDYGCGKGDDLKELQAHELDATGWDPVYLPDPKKEKSDIVNLGFVLNVIEEPEERKECLAEAAQLSNKLLVASVMLENQNTSEIFTPYKDGVLTKRNTFQKYYSQSEFKAYLESILKKQPIAVGPGIFYIFNDELEEQKYLSNRYRRTTDWVMKTQKQKVIKAQKVRLNKFEKHKDIIGNYWEHILDFGRMPTTSEFDHYPIIASVFGSQKKGFEEAINLFGKDGYQEARKNRIDDLRVYFALSMFEQRKPYKNMPDSLQRDVKEFFGKYTNGVAQSRNLLFSVGKPEVIQQACEEYHKNEKVGFIYENHSYQFHVSEVENLPPELKIYIACASRLYGDVQNVDLIKIHFNSGKLTLLSYIDFKKSPLPDLKQRIKINLKTQQISFFDYGDRYPYQPLYLKSNFIRDSFTNYKKQMKFDEKLVDKKLFDLCGFGPPKEIFNEVLLKEQLEVKNWEIVVKRKTNIK